MKINVKQQVPPGAYTARFDGVTLTTHDEYGDGLQWQWTIASGAMAGQQVFRTTKPHATAKNATGKFLRAVTSLPLEQAATIDLDTYIGREHQVIVAEGQGGSSRVEHFAAIEAAPTAAPAPATPAPTAPPAQADLALTGPADVDF